MTSGEEFTLQLFNAYGQLLTESAARGNATIFTTSLAPGIYYYRVYGKGGGRGSGKFIKE